MAHGEPQRCRVPQGHEANVAVHGKIAAEYKQTEPQFGPKILPGALTDLPQPDCGGSAPALLDLGCVTGSS